MADIWNIIILEPVLNSLIALTNVLGGSFGLAIIVLTVVVRLILFPLTVRQTQSTKAMQTLQPKIQELQKRYAKNQQKLQQEMMKLYKDSSVPVHHAGFSSYARELIEFITASLFLVCNRPCYTVG
jgi:YidC/Oxa1 family membrane protein insertase